MVEDRWRRMLGEALRGVNLNGDRERGGEAQDADAEGPVPERGVVLREAGDMGLARRGAAGRKRIRKGAGRR